MAFPGIAGSCARQNGTGGSYENRSFQQDSDRDRLNRWHRLCHRPWPCGLLGATVVVNGLTQAAVDRAVAGVRASTPKAELRGLAADLSTAAGCNALIEAEPRCDILVNNVGMYGPQDFFDISDSEWTRFFELNVMSGVRLSRAYMPGMLERDWGARCVSLVGSGAEYSA
jgi:NAD(P)-dependent dehydrogenase (short-subunit alcohol dehydrogenase family)